MNFMARKMTSGSALRIQADIRCWVVMTRTSPRIRSRSRTVWAMVRRMVLRLPPVRYWMSMAVTKISTSLKGIRLAERKSHAHLAEAPPEPDADGGWHIAADQLQALGQAKARLERVGNGIHR